MLKSDLLHHCEWIMGSDDDQPILNEVYIGFDPLDNFIVCIDHINYCNHRLDCSTWAVVDNQEAQALASINGIEVLQLPEFFQEWMMAWRQIPNASLSQTIGCFKEITECLLDEGCHFRIERTVGAGGRVCC